MSSGALANRYTASSIYLNRNLTFRDPTPDFFSALNEIMFRTCLAAATASDVQQVSAMQ